MKITLTVLLIVCAILPAMAATFYEEYQKGIQLENAGKWSEARESFLEAARLHPVPGRRVRTTGMSVLQHYDPYIHLAHCEARLGMMDQAKEHFALSKQAGVTPAPLLNEMETRFTRAKDAKPFRKRFRDRLLKPQIQRESQADLSLLRSTSTPSGALVLIDGMEKGSTPLEVELPAGIYSIRYELKGYEPAEKSLVLTSGETQTIDVNLARIVPLTPAVKKMESNPDAAKSEPAPPPAVAQVPVPRSVVQAEPATDEPEFTVASPLILGSLLALIIAATIGVAYKARKTVPPELTSKTIAQPVRISSDDTPTEYIAPTSFKPDSSENKTAVLPLAKPLPAGIETEFGAYRLKGLLGRGGMGTTYLATRESDKLPVALKIPHEHLLDNEEFVARFLREGQLGSTLHHPNIIRIYDSGRVGQKPYIAMEVLQGATLEQRLQESAPLAFRAALETARDIALALDYARLKGIVHRDLKPENIMMLDRGGLKVMDYGIARIVGSPGLTSSDAYLGTPSYSSPEATSGDVDQQSDLYSLGIILYRMLTGSLPFRSVDPLQVLMMHRSQPLPQFPVEVQLPAAIFELVDKLTQKEKTNRYPDAEAFLIDLNKLLNALV